MRSEPRAGERLATSPALIRLEFSEILMARVSRIVLVGPVGDTVELGPVDSMGSHTIAARPAGSLTGGTYRVHWVAAGRDGHPERGSFSFTVAGSHPAAPGAPAALAAPIGVSGDTAASDNPADAIAQGRSMTIARWLGFLALFSVIGAVAFRFVVLGRLARFIDVGDPFLHIASVGAATYGLFASVALVLTTVIKLYGESLAMRDIPLEAILFATGWGWAWCAQLIACLIAIVAFAIAHRGTRNGWLMAALAAVVLVVTPAATGHAIGSDQALLTVPLDVLHVLAGSTWLGTLAVILIVGIGSAAKTPGTVSLGARVAAMINAFSPMALVCGGTIVATGAFASLLHLEPLSSLWTSWYGRVLLVKLAFVVLLFVVGAWNWRRIKPSLGGDEGVTALRFSAKVEVSVAAMVLMVTAFLVALPLPD
ncbi:MAG TPA: CopD family protein [Gemmatimonadaceae bacterium]|nr:CopD family protein [Gemmatimonadaceae bacterium]